MRTYEERARSALARIESYQLKKQKQRKLAFAILMPAAGVCIAAVLGLIVWQSGVSRNEAPTADGGMVALSEGANHNPAASVEAPEPEDPAEMPARNAEEQKRSPAKPFDEKPAETNDIPPEKPFTEEATEEPAVTPETEPSAEPSSENTEEPPDEPEAQVEPTPQTTPSVSGSYRMEGDREYVTLTLLSTGEIEEIDVTGWRNNEREDPAGEQPDEVTGHSGTSYSDQCTAFGVIVIYFLIPDENNEVRVETLVIEHTGTQSAGDPDALTPEAEAAIEASEAAARAALTGSFTEQEPNEERSKP